MNWKYREENSYGSKTSIEGWWGEMDFNGHIHDSPAGVYSIVTFATITIL